MVAYALLAFAILITAVLVYVVIHYHAKFRDKDDPKFLIIIGILLVLVADTWISVYGSTVRDFFTTYHFLLTIIPLLIYGVYLAFTHKHRKERAAKLQLKSAFQRYVIPDIIDEIIRDPSKLKLGGEERRLAILFSDIRSFTTLSEGMTAKRLVHMLNIYLSRMTQLILDQRGSVDKYIGDAIMAFWGAPVDEKQNSVRACRAALNMQAELASLMKSAEWQKEKFPKIEVGIGINTGSVVVGNVGSEDRFDYTVLGDQVNLGSRLEGLTKEYGVGVIVSESTKHDIENAFQTRELDTVMVKGKKKGVVIFELLSDEEAKRRKVGIKRYEKALQLYRKHYFKEAKKLFVQNKSDKASKLMAARCDELQSMKLPKTWSGVYEMKTK